VDDDEDKMMAALSRFPFWAPVLVLLVWFLVGQRDLAGLVMTS
jgi:hypothetical protein